MSVTIIQGDANQLPLADNSVDLVVTSPPYFALRSYQDGGQHYAGQLGSEATPAAYVDALLAATVEMVRVLKPAGSIWVNLGDKYTNRSGGKGWGGSKPFGGNTDRANETISRRTTETRPDMSRTIGMAEKSLIGIPWRYAIACIDQLGLILRAEVIWSKPNGLPESVTDRVRRSHEQWFHFTTQPRYYSAVDEIREPQYAPSRKDGGLQNRSYGEAVQFAEGARRWHPKDIAYNPLGKLPGSVWSIPTEPLTLPAYLGVDHYAAFPSEWPRRIIAGWSPPGICTICGEGRRPVVDMGASFPRDKVGAHRHGKVTAERGDGASINNTNGQERNAWRAVNPHTLTGYVCGCPNPSAPTRPSVILDPFGGTGTTALVADVLGRHGITIDMSADYSRVADWRTHDPTQQAHAARVDKPPPQVDGQAQLFNLEGAL